MSRSYTGGLAIAALALLSSSFFAIAAAAEQSKPPAQGKALFDENCGVCHAADSNETKVGPGLKGLFKNKTLPKSQKPATEANIRTQIENGAPNAQPVPMPAFKDKLTQAQIRGLLQYLKSL